MPLVQYGDGRLIGCRIVVGAVVGELHAAAVLPPIGEQSKDDTRISDIAHGDALLLGAVLVVAGGIAAVEVFVGGAVVGGRTLAPTGVGNSLQLRLRQFAGRGVEVAVVDHGDGVARADGAIRIDVGLLGVAEHSDAHVMDELAFHGGWAGQVLVVRVGLSSVGIGCRAILQRCRGIHRVGIIYKGVGHLGALGEHLGIHAADVPVAVVADGEVGAITQDGYALRLVVQPVHLDGEDNLGEFVEEVMTRAADGCVLDTCNPEPVERTGLSVNQERQVVVYLRG